MPRRTLHLSRSVSRITVVALAALPLLVAAAPGADSSAPGAQGSAAALPADLGSAAQLKPGRPVKPLIHGYALGRSERSAAPSSSAAQGSAADVQDVTAPVTGFATVGVTWSGPASPAGLEVRARTADSTGTWGTWDQLEADPRPNDSGSPQGVPGTEPLTVGAVAQVEVQVLGASAAGISNVKLSVVDPGLSGADVASLLPSTPVGGKSAPVAQFGAGSSGGPGIYSRADWGADESQMTWAPQQGDFKGAVIHHTAGTNDYQPGDVPAIIRGIYAYHAVTRGWGDIGYNFLVDRFGRTWEGRAGGVELETIGAHTQGYNTNTVGVAFIGNSQTASVPDAAVSAIVSLLAWKLSLHGVDAGGRMVLNGHNLPTIIGHRDVGSTDCPGQSLWSRLDEIRSRVKAAQGAYSGLFGTGTGSLVKSPYTPAIYLVAGTTKHHIPTMAVLDGLTKLGRVQDASTLYLNYLSTGPDVGFFVRNTASGSITLVDRGTLYHVPTCTIAAAFGLRCTASAFINLTAQQLARLTLSSQPVRRAIKATNNAAVYWMTNGRKQHIESWASLQRLAGSTPSYTTLGPDIVGSFPAGAPIP